MKKKIIIMISIICMIGLGLILNNKIAQYNEEQAKIKEGSPTHIEYVIEELQDGVWVETDRYTVYIID